MATGNFIVSQGIRIEGCDKIHAAYECRKINAEWKFTVVLDAPKIPSLLNSYCAVLPEPGYFTLEIPTKEDEIYDIYYVDGCTKSVLQAIIKRYGTLLCEDGDVRFGFSSHISSEQIYVGDLKTVLIYTNHPEKIHRILQENKIPQENKCLKLWDLSDEGSECELMHVEINGENIFDLPDLLHGAGIYLAGRRNDKTGKATFFTKRN